jgi:hypothetical protein
MVVDMSVPDSYAFAIVPPSSVNLDRFPRLSRYVARR